MSSATGPWIGDKEDIDGPKDEAGSVGVFHQELFEMQGEDSFVPGAEKIGDAHGVVVLLPDKKTLLTMITLEFNDGSLVATGSLPLGPSMSRGRSIGPGLLAVTGRTGNLKDALPRLKVEVSNPKKYSNQP